ncbi:MAG: DUF1697 domain-containing protein [Candidatus Micrarchaeota archaeon]|nr:DUF1697 domain-containing protein [Candidatus Micrarchaeota archaeon]
MEYIAMLRGVNVGGKKMSMAELRELCGSLKLKNPRTYIQSGNIVVDYGGDGPKLADLLEKGIKKRFGMDVRVLVRTVSELKEVVVSNPFGEAAYVTFLSDRAKGQSLDAINSAKTATEELKFSEREVYLLCPEGYGRTKLSNNFLESKLGITATTRNMRTIKALLGMAGNQS